MKKPLKKIVSPVSLREVYAEVGDYSAKMIIDSTASQNIDSVDVDIRNADGRTMEFTSRRWGTKLTVAFKIDGTTPDGVSVIDMTFRWRDRNPTRERLDFWIIK